MGIPPERDPKKRTYYTVGRANEAGTGLLPTYAICRLEQLPRSQKVARQRQGLRACHQASAEPKVRHSKLIELYSQMK